VAKPVSEGKTQVKQNEAKWSPELMRAGWTAVPSVILEYQHKLGLDALDVNILLQLATFWWHKENLPRPAKATIAKRMDVDPSTVRRRIAKLEKAGLIKRIARRTDTGQRPNEYDFTGLIEQAKPYALQKQRDREERKRQDATRQRKGFKVISGGKAEA